MAMPLIHHFNRYLISLNDNPRTSYHAGLAGEVAERFEQIYFIVSRIEAIEREYIDELRKQDDRDLGGQLHFMKTQLSVYGLELRILTESFYYFASRVRTIFRHKDRPLPFLHNFECAGVRDVRNHLIEHPEGKESRIFSQSFTFGTYGGPFLKDLRSPLERQHFKDLGFRANLSEFSDNIVAILNRAVSRA